MTQRLTLLIVAALLGVASARAGQLATMDIGAGSGGSGGGCTNSLNFSQACNSQYVGEIGIF